MKMRPDKSPLLAVCALLIASSIATASDEVSLKVTVTGLEPLQGQAIVSLFNEKKQFLKQPLEMIAQAVPDSDSLMVEFESLEAGVYAVSVVYDLDGDGELDTGFFSIPSEPIGVSNNVRSKFGPPRWKKAKFDLEQDMHLEIEVADAID